MDVATRMVRLSGSLKKRVFPPTRPRSLSPIAPLLPRIPSGLKGFPPVNAIFEGNRTIYEYASPPFGVRFDGGAIVGTAKLQLLFWGDFWTNASNPSLNDLQKAAAEILASPYLSELNQYGFQGLTLNEPMIVVEPGPPFPHFDGGDVKGMVWNLIDDGRFPEPGEEGGRIIYMVLAPQGTVYDHGGDPGAHGAAVEGLFDRDTAWVAWVNHDVIDGMTAVFTHELVETITDPEPHSGWSAPSFDDDDNEVVDICFNQVGPESGYAVAAYYSNRLKACVVPTTPFRRSLTLTERDQLIGAPTRFDGETATTIASKCFHGTYHWTLWSAHRRVTVDADVSSYIRPDITWSVNGRELLSGGSTTTLNVPSEQTADPLHRITNLPDEKVSVAITARESQLVIETGLGTAAADLDIKCEAKESDLPDGYRTNRFASTAVFVSGRQRIMDDRFERDSLTCFTSGINRSRFLLINEIIPNIDRGDPPPPQVVTEVAAIDQELVFETGDVERASAFVRLASETQLTDDGGNPR